MKTKVLLTIFLILYCLLIASRSIGAFAESSSSLSTDGNEEDENVELTKGESINVAKPSKKSSVKVRKVERAKANDKDLKHIRCDVCKYVVDDIMRNAIQWITKTEPALERLFDIACKTDTRGWTRMTDIVVNKTSSGESFLALQKETPKVAPCGIECETMVKACNKFVDEVVDRERVVNYFRSHEFLSVPVETHQEKICNEFSKQCPNTFTLTDKDLASRSDEIFLETDLSEVHKEFEKRRKKLQKIATDKGVSAVFEVSEDVKNVRAKLYYEELYRGELSHSTVIRQNTFFGHRWSARINGRIIKEWAVGIEPLQFFTLTWDDIKERPEAQPDL